MFWAPYGISELPEVHFEFPFNLIGKLTMVFFNRPIMVRSQILVGAGRGQEQRFWCCFIDRLNQKLISIWGVRRLWPLKLLMLLLFHQIAVRFTNPVMVRTSAALYKPFSMLAKQESLPPLPVPTLQQTMDKYLKAIKPLVDEEDFEYTEDLVKNFSKPKGDGEVLQNLLLEKMKTEKNWVSTSYTAHISFHGQLLLSCHA